MIAPETNCGTLVFCLREETETLEAKIAAKLGSTMLEHFSEKWSPVFRQKMRPLDKTRVLSGSFEPENTLAASAIAIPYLWRRC
jgi:hypothetical protein